MTDRLTRIVNGCNVVGDLASQGNVSGALFKNTATRLVGLLNEQLQGIPDPIDLPPTDEQIQEIFNAEPRS
jgi:hypothetical protein